MEAMNISFLSRRGGRGCFRARRTGAASTTVVDRSVSKLGKCAAQTTGSSSHVSVKFHWVGPYDCVSRYLRYAGKMECQVAMRIARNVHLHLRLFVSSRDTKSKAIARETDVMLRKLGSAPFPALRLASRL